MSAVPTELSPSTDHSTKRQAAEHNLTPTEEIFRLLVSAVTDYAIFALDTDGYIRTWNPGARRLKGYEPDEVIGTHFSRFYTPEDQARCHPQDELRLAAQNGTYQEEGWRIRKDGTRFWANVVITALKNPDGTLRGFGKVTRDLTERKKAEDELRDAYASLERRVTERTAELALAKEQAERALKARDDFLSIASHELKTPITSLKLQAQITRRSAERNDPLAFEPSRVKRMMDQTEKQVNRLVRLVDNMLDIARIAGGKLTIHHENVDLVEVVRDTAEKLLPQMSLAGCELTLSLPASLFGSVDRFRLEQVIINLLSNSAKYGAGKPIDLTMTDHAHFAEIRVTDRGRGIAPEDMKRIFERFERAISANDVSGLGLGLFISRQIVELHHGTIEVESELQKGSTFIVRLPK